MLANIAHALVWLFALPALGLGLLVANVLRKLITGMALTAGSERAAHKLGLASALGDKTLASLLGSVVFALILLPTLAAALQTLGIDAVIGLSPRLVSAAVIVAVAAVLGRAGRHRRGRFALAP